ncbi:MAG: response regulator transcription factor [Chloroflexi bacterium]|nr:response regulator transcription factor [Chloroflexota bacterium]
MARRILVVDDEKGIVDLVDTYLRRAGFDVLRAYDGPSALATFRHDHPDLIILDLNLPGIDGLDVARAIRQNSRVPILMLTAREGEMDRIVGLELGADDYVPKPFSPRELVARVRAILRRVEGPAPYGEILKSGDLMLDTASFTAMYCGSTLALTPTEFRLLEALMRAPGRAYTRLQLLDLALGETFEGYERNIDVHIKNIRAKLEDDPRNPTYILTVPTVGYKFRESSDV